MTGGRKNVPGEWYLRIIFTRLLITANVIIVLMIAV